MKLIVRNIHKYLSFFISVQLLLWTVSGIYFAFNKIELVRGEQYRLTNQIKFIDHCEDMALAYKVSDIIVSASIEPEAFGRVAVEAQSMDK